MSCSSPIASDTCAADQAGVVLVSGESFDARLQRIDEKWHLTFDTGNDRQVRALTDVVRWGGYRDTSAGPQIVLADGGLIVARQLKLEQGQLRFTSRLFADASLPVELVRGIVYRPPNDPLQRDLLIDRVLSFDGTSDQLLLQNGDALQGTLLTTVDAGDEATAADPATAAIKIDIGRTTVDIPRDRISAVVFNPLLVEPPKQPGLCARLGFRDGSSLIVEQVTPRQDRLEMLLPGGPRIETHPDYEPATTCEPVTSLEAMSPALVYLSDLQPWSYKHIPFLSLDWPYRPDRNVLGGRLRTGGFVSAKGLGMHSTSRLAYNITGEHRQFAAELAIDDLAGRKGSVEFRVFLDDGSGGFRQAFQSGLVRGGDPPVAMSVDVSRARRLILIVDFADRADELDYANWLNARLVK